MSARIVQSWRNMWAGIWLKCIGPTTSIARFFFLIKTGPACAKTYLKALLFLLGRELCHDQSSQLLFAQRWREVTNQLRQNDKIHAYCCCMRKTTADENHHVRSSKWCAQQRKPVLFGFRKRIPYSHTHLPVYQLLSSRLGGLITLQWRQ